MAHHRLGNAAKARQWLAKSAEVIGQTGEAKTQEPGAETWNRKLTLQLRRREAADLLGVKEGSKQSAEVKNQRAEIRGQ